MFVIRIDDRKAVFGETELHRRHKIQQLLQQIIHSLGRGHSHTGPQSCELETGRSPDGREIYREKVGEFYFEDATAGAQK